jgi:hypothetical protein
LGKENSDGEVNTENTHTHTHTHTHAHTYTKHNNKCQVQEQQKVQSLVKVLELFFSCLILVLLYKWEL